MQSCNKLAEHICGCGEIGRHARFRFWCREAWGFKSLHPHQSFKVGDRTYEGRF